MVDRTLSGRYRLDSRIGEGGMATVYGGTDTLLRRRVAIKVLREQLAADSEFVRRFYHEAEAAAKLSYPNIVSIYDVGRQDDTYYIVMELVDGTTLAEILEHDGSLPETVAIDYAEQICRGLAYAHRQGILHRDIKPANILITKDDVVKLSDFGIARAVSTQTMTMTMPGMVMGSVYYISPEQAQGHELGAGSDLYSLGVVLYQMLSGSLPYTGESPITVALKHVSSPPPQIESANGAISPALAAIVRKLLQKDPQNRYSSATEVAAALREARDDPHTAHVAAAAATATQPVRAARRSAPNPPPRPSPSPDRPTGSAPTALIPVVEAPYQRTKIIALVSGLLALLVLAAAAGFFIFDRRGGPFGAPAKIAVPNLSGRTAAEAEVQLTSAGLAYTVTQEPSETVARERVVRQNPPPTSLLAAQGIVQLVVSSGMPIVSVADLRAYSREDAERYAKTYKLQLKVVEKFDSAPRGTVLAQHPDPGPRPIHSTITLVISKGLAPIDVPSVVTMDTDAATAILAQHHLRAVIGQKIASDNIPANVVSSQDPAPGTSVDPGTPVTLEVSMGPAGVVVPDVGGRNIDEAEGVLRSAGLAPSFRYSLQPGDTVGAVIDESPAAGSQVQHGSLVTLTVVVSGTVPDVSGMTLDQAKQTLLHDGYQLGNTAFTTNGTEGRVYGTEPAANASLRPGEAVTLYYNAGANQPGASSQTIPPSQSEPTPDSSGDSQ